MSSAHLFLICIWKTSNCFSLLSLSHKISLTFISLRTWKPMEKTFPIFPDLWLLHLYPYTSPSLLLCEMKRASPLHFHAGPCSLLPTQVLFPSPVYLSLLDSPSSKYSRQMSLLWLPFLHFTCVSLGTIWFLSSLL